MYVQNCTSALINLIPENKKLNIDVLSSWSMEARPHMSQCSKHCKSTSTTNVTPYLPPKES